MYRGLVVSPFFEQRVKLQRVLEQGLAFREVNSLHSLEEAMPALSKSPKLDFIFIPDTFDEKEIGEFISSAKKSRAAEHASFILLNRESTQDKDEIAHKMVLGFHGFLFEPYSEAAVEEVLSLSKKVYEKKSQARLRAATGLMLTDTIAEIEGISPDDDSRNTWDKVKHSCEQYKKLTGESLTLAVVGTLEKLSPSKRLPIYNGASTRVRSLLKDRLKRTLRINTESSSIEDLLPPKPPQTNK